VSRSVSTRRIVVLGLVMAGLAGLFLASCAPQPAPTPDVEALAQALAKTWATQTAQAAPAARAGPGGATVTTTAPATPATAAVTPTITSPSPASPPTAAPSPSDTPMVSPTLTSTPRPSRTPVPSSTPTPACAIATDPELVQAWDRAALGCPTAKAEVIAAVWERFQNGYMLRRGDLDWTYVLNFQGGADSEHGDWVAGGDAWRWDGSFPNGHGLTPPLGMYEPVRELGYVWFTKLGGQTGQVGWATAPEERICVTLQPFEDGTIAKTYPGSCDGPIHSNEPVFVKLSADGTWQRLPMSRPPTSTPSPLPPCGIAVDPQLASGYDRARLGCPLEKAAVVWAAWQPFEHGSMLWRSDKDWTYALNFQGGADPQKGDWVTGGDAWRWDGSFPDGRGLTAPAGKYEPVRGFGLAWYSFLGGPSSQLGWATDREKGICVRLQAFDSGLIFGSSAVGSCQDGMFNMAQDPSFAPILIALQNNGAWQRH
jgi:hypothetical protein